MQKPSFSAIFPFERIDGDQRKKRLTPTVTETESDTAATEKRKRRTSTPPQQSDRTARISAQRKIPPAISVISKPQRLRDQKDEIEDPVRRPVRLLGVSADGIYKDLMIWGMLCLIFAAVFLIFTLRMKKQPDSSEH